MYKQTFNFIDFLGHQREEEHYFNLTKAEVMLWLTTENGYTLDELLKQLAAERNVLRIMEIIDDMIKRSYGRISPDGRKFEKSEEIANDFAQTEAYSQLFMELIMDVNKTTAFIMAIIPKNLADDIDNIMNDTNADIPKDLKVFLAEQSSSSMLDKASSVRHVPSPN